MSTTLKEVRPCPSCGKPLPAGALAGLCPACLLAQGADTDAGDGARTGRFEPPPLEEVSKLFPQLEILCLLGAGGMGAVYKARQPALDRMVALKILPATNAGGVNFAERFNREARALARLSHPNIVAVHEFGQLGALSYFIMEFVDGANLRQLEQGSRLAPREALQIIPQICDALQYAHDEGVVHRDIKPENVLIDRKGRVKIADFGLAKILGTDVESLRLTAEGQVMGTPHYMAPEQVERPLAVDHRADIYALGVVFYEMLTGDLPLGKFSPPSRKVQVDVRFDDVVLRALENDPARRYQRAGEVKTQVENIAGSPGMAPSPVVRKPSVEFVRCGGFPLLIKKSGRPAVHWLGVLQLFAITFGLLTVAFGIVSISTGRSLWDWFGVIGLPSVLVRFAVSAMVVVWGLRRAWLRRDQPETAPRDLPRTPQGTAILPAEGVSRKAVIGAWWAPLFFFAGLLYFMVSTVSVVHGDAASIPEPAAQWWQILLGVTVLPLGLAAPFGTTIMGWLAVGDIRRSQGRISGMPLAVFDGLLFPLLTFNALLAWLWVISVRAVAEGQGDSHLSGFWPAISSVGAVVVCLIATFDISRRVWRAVRLGGLPAREGGEWWWSSKPGGVVIAVLCILILGLVANRHSASRPKGNTAAQVAVRDAQSGRLVAKLPGGGTVELLAIGERYGAPNGWWSAEGTPLSNEIYEVRGGVDNVMGNRVPKEVLVRAIDLPDGASSAGVEADPMSFSGSGGEVFLNSERVPGARQVRLAWDASVRKASLRFGYGLESWRTIAAHDAGYRSYHHRHLTTDPAWTINFHPAPIETRDGAQVALVFGPEDRRWTHRVVAIDTNGVEHAYLHANGTPIEKLTLWTYTFHKLPLAAVKEFRLQVRPVHWVEFRDVVLGPKGPLPKARRPQFGPAHELSPGQAVDLDLGVISAIVAGDRDAPFRNLAASSEALRQQGIDLVAGAGELRVFEMDFVVLDNSDWNDIRPHELADRILQDHYRPREVKPVVEGQLPATFGFRTIEQTVGILQLLPLSGTMLGPTMRYKLLQIGGESRASAELWSPKGEPGQAIDLSQIRNEANELMTRGDYEESLQRHLWIHNHALEVDPNMAGVRLSFYLMDWVELGRRYPRARNAMIEIRDRKTRELEEGMGTAELFADVNALNRELKTEGLTVALFKRIHESDPQLAARCFPHANKALVVNREYALCLSYIPDLQRHLRRLAADHVDALRRLEKNPGPQAATLRAMADRLFADNISMVLEILRGVGRNEDAASIRDEAIRVLGDPSLLPEESEAQDKPTGTGVLVK